MIRRLSAALLLAVSVCWTCVHAGESRIVSLAPHLTELVFDAGAGDMLVGAVDYSDHPPAARDVPRVGDAFRVDRERLAELAPDLVFAWQGGTPAAVIGQLREDGYDVRVFETSEPEDVAATLVDIGNLTGEPELATVRAREYLDELEILRKRYANRRLVTVFVQVAPRPLYTVNDRQIIGRVVSLCGGRNIFAELDDLAPLVSEEAVVAADPEVIIATARASEDVFARWRRFTSLAAVRGDQLHYLDPDLVSRPTLRLAEGARMACEKIDQARG